MSVGLAPDNVTENELQCYHCGSDCDNSSINWENHVFCCSGCKTVCQILTENGMENYYSFESFPGVKMETELAEDQYLFLENPEIENSLLHFSDHKIARVTFNLPDIHCSSCIWLLENLNRINSGVLESRIHFSRKTVDIKFSKDAMNLKQLASLLNNIGYPPLISLNKQEGKKRSFDIPQIKLGVAGFCFGNVMLLSFPEYFGIDETSSFFVQFFGWLNLAFSIPVLVFSGNEYFVSAFKAIKYRYINIDVPIALGMAVLFGRSAYEIISGVGAGFLDSFTGLVFFLLIGKWFQNKTYDILSFERDFKSFFPLAVTRLKESGSEEVEKEIVPIDRIEKEDILFLRNEEIIPVDCELLTERAMIDYSFVTGEQDPTTVKKGDKIFAGGKLTSGTIEVAALKPVAQSYLTSLWENAGNEVPKVHQRLLDKIGKYFTFFILLLAILTAGYWSFFNPDIVWTSVTSVLIVACPCALALSLPFTFGNVLRVLGRNKLYLRSADMIEKFFSINTIIFDKTGTLTSVSGTKVNWLGVPLHNTDKEIIAKVCESSIHPYSKKIFHHLKNSNFQSVQLSEINEKTSLGIEAIINGDQWKIGKRSWVKGDNTEGVEGQVYISKNDQYLGCFQIQSQYRNGLERMLLQLRNHFSLYLFSGDNDSEKAHLGKWFDRDSKLFFGMKPDDKSYRLQELQANGNQVLMIGDGLNDGLALKKSDLGLSVADDSAYFTPNSDGILLGEALNKLDQMILFVRKSKSVLKWALLLSLLYNSVGLYFAVTGVLTPVIAAILMPLSSISVVIFTFLTVNLLSNFYKLN